MAWKFPDQLPKTASSRDHALVRLTLLTNEGFSISAAKVLATSRNQGQNASSVAFLFIGYFAISFLILSNLPIALIEGAQSTVATRARSRYERTRGDLRLRFTLPGKQQDNQKSQSPDRAHAAAHSPHTLF